MGTIHGRKHVLSQDFETFILKAARSGHMKHSCSYGNNAHLRVIPCSMQRPDCCFQLSRTHQFQAVIALSTPRALEGIGFRQLNDHYFDTPRFEVPGGVQAVGQILKAAQESRINLGYRMDNTIHVALDETVDRTDILALLAVFGAGATVRTVALDESAKGLTPAYPSGLARATPYLTHPVFNTHHSETQMMRYIRSLERKDIGLDTSMIPLGSCTMKLNAASEMLPITWPEFGKLHPFAPPDQAAGYRILFDQLEAWLAEITGFARVSLQPNAGSQGEFAGLLVIRRYHASRGEGARDVCLIPQSAHGTNPASAVMAGLEVVAVKTDGDGNVDLGDLRAKAEAHADRLAAQQILHGDIAQAPPPIAPIQRGEDGRDPDPDGEIFAQADDLPDPVSRRRRCGACRSTRGALRPAPPGYSVQFALMA